MILSWQLARQVDLRSEWFGEDFAQDFRKSLCIRVTSEGVRSPVKSSEIRIYRDLVHRDSGFSKVGLNPCLTKILKKMR